MNTTKPFQKEIDKLVKENSQTKQVFQDRKISVYDNNNCFLFEAKTEEELVIKLEEYKDYIVDYVNSFVKWVTK